jgi:AraC-like DNA-binding protein
MVVLSINDINFKKIMHGLADKAGIKHDPDDDYIVFEPPHGTGYFKTITLVNGIEVLFIDVTYGDTVVTIRNNTGSPYFILSFDEANFEEKEGMLQIGDNQFKKSRSSFAGARLTSNIFTNIEQMPPDVHLKSIRILLPQKWLQQYLGLSSTDDVLQRFLALKTESFEMEPFDIEYRKLIDEVWSVKQDDPMQDIFLQNRVTLLIERFFTRLYSKMNMLEGKFNLSSDNINRLIDIEKVLVSDFSLAPPTIEKLSRMASMSTTKLKKDFKTIYGNSIYAYYQDRRLEKANELLISGGKSVKQVAEAVGFNSVSNFSLAYKKKYNQEPAALSL